MLFNLKEMKTGTEAQAEFIIVQQNFSFNFLM